ncbi:MAG: glycosyltransferase family protein [Flavobacterium sp.]
MKILLCESYPENVSREKIVLEELGNSVYLFNFYLHTKRINNKLINKIVKYLPIDFVFDELNKNLINLVDSQNFDMMLVYYGKEIYPETLSYIKTKIPLVVNWNGDELFNKLNNNQNILNSLAIYDFHCSPRHHLKSEYLLKGVKQFIEVDWYYKTVLDQPINSLPIINGNFIGSWSPKRERIISSISDDEMSIHGWGWKKKSKCTNKKIGVLLTEKSMNQVFSNSKISINILTDENRDNINFRNYEIPSQYGFQITERSDRILEIFQEDKTIVCFSGTEELNDKYKFYLNNDKERRKIVANSFNLLKSNSFDLKTQMKKVLTEIQK